MEVMKLIVIIIDDDTNSEYDYDNRISLRIVLKFYLIHINYF